MWNLRLRSVVLLSVAVLVASTVLTVVPAAAEPGDPPGVDLEVYTGQVDQAGVQKMRELGVDAADVAGADTGSGATNQVEALGSCDAVIICVPTPLRKTRDPDISYIVAAVDGIASTLHPDMLVILESTTYPGTTEEVIRPKLESTS